MAAPTASALLAVAVGGALGSVSRWLLSLWVAQAAPAQAFPLGTFAVNLAGCFAAGVVAGLAERHGCFGPELRLFLTTGLLGGFTTFSAFGIETMQLLRRGEWLLAAGYAGASLVLGIALAALGIRLALAAPALP